MADILMTMPIRQEPTLQAPATHPPFPSLQAHPWIENADRHSLLVIRMPNTLFNYSQCFGFCLTFLVESPFPLAYL